MMKRLIVVGIVAVMGCSDDDPKGTTPTGDGGTSPSGNTAKFTGQMEGYTSKGPVADADVEAAGVKGKTTSKGTFELDLPKDTAFHLQVSKADFFTLYDQEMKVSKDADLPKLRFVDKNIGNILLGSLSAKADKAVVSVGLKQNDACKGKDPNFPGGAKITVEGQPDAKVIYYKGTPQKDLTEAAAGEDPAAVVFNANPNEELKIKVEYSKCSMRAWPVTEGDITYTGKLVPKAPETLSVYRVFYE